MRVLALKSDKDLGTLLPAPKNSAHPVNQQYVVGEPHVQKKPVPEPAPAPAAPRDSNYDYLMKKVATLKRVQEAAQAVASMRTAELTALVERNELFGAQAAPVVRELETIQDILRKLASGAVLTAKEVAILKAAVPSEDGSEDGSEDTEESEELPPLVPPEEESEEESEEEREELPPMEVEEGGMTGQEVSRFLYQQVLDLARIPKAYQGSGNGPNLGPAAGRILFAGSEPDMSENERGLVAVEGRIGRILINTPGVALLMVATTSGLDKYASRVSPIDAEAFLGFLTTEGLIGDKKFTAKRLWASLRSKTAGEGLRTRKPPKSSAARADKTGRLGVIKIDLPLLGTGVLVLKDAKNKLMLRRPASPGLAYLLTHRGSMAGAGIKYQKKDLEDFHEVLRMADVHIPSHTAKARALLPGVQDAIFLPKDVPTLEARLEVLRGEHGAGNMSHALVNEALVIADILLTKRALSKRDHEAVFRQLVQ